MAINYKCPGCGDAMVFMEGTDNLVCESCGTEIEVQEFLKDREDAKDEIITDNNKEDTYKVIKCSTCGAELMTDEHTSSTFCAFCGNPTLIEDRLSGEASPAYVIPFKIKKDKVTEEFRSWAGKGFFTPSGFRRESTIEKISGIYVPFWLYDFDTRYSASLTCTVVRHSSDKEYNYTHTDWYEVHRDLSGDYKKIPADASEKMDDDIMDMLEPFNYMALTPFEMPYLSGFLSEKYNFDAHELLGRAKERVSEFLDEELNKTLVKYSGREIKYRDKQIKQTDVKYAVLPVWILNYRYHNNNYTFAMNGQTGKIVGKRPISKGKAAATFGVVTAVVFTILTVIGGLL